MKIKEGSTVEFIWLGRVRTGKIVKPWVGGYSGKREGWWIQPTDVEDGKVARSCNVTDSAIITNK